MNSTPIIGDGILQSPSLGTSVARSLSSIIFLHQLVVYRYLDCGMVHQSKKILFDLSQALQIFMLTTLFLSLTEFSGIPFR
jgi:hypothetical protein